MGIEKNWKIQEPGKPVIHDTPDEWKAVRAYQAELNKNNSASSIDKNTKFQANSTNGYKITRDQLKNFVKKRRDLNIPDYAINHSFFAIPDSKETSGFLLGVLARSKPYNAHPNRTVVGRFMVNFVKRARRLFSNNSNPTNTLGLSQYINEGIIGYGTYGRVNPAKFVSTREGLSEVERTSIFAVKTMDGGKKTINQSENEIRIRKLLGDKVHLILRTRNETNKELKTEWIGKKNVSSTKAYVVMPLEKGIELFEYIKNNPPTDQNRLEYIKIAIAIATELENLQNRNILHRDIKPENILIYHDSDNLKDDYTAKFIDYGFAIALLNNQIYNPEKIEGTPQYMAPEIAKRCYDTNGKVKNIKLAREPKYSFASEIYALGVCLKYMGLEFPMMNDGIPDQRPSISSVLEQLLKKQESCQKTMKKSVFNKQAARIPLLFSKQPSNTNQNKQCYFTATDEQTNSLPMHHLKIS